MKLRDEPGLVTGTAVGAILALAVYYKLLDVEGASLWGALAVFIVPPLQGWIARRFTVPLSKIEDAEEHTPALNVENIDAAAASTRRRRKATP